MHPVLIELGPVTVSVYGGMLAGAFLAGIALTHHETKRLNLSPEMLPGLSFCVLLYTLVGARALYVVVNPHLFFDNPVQALMPWNGGLMLQGGALAGAAAGSAYVRSHGQSLLVWGDAVAPALALGQSLTGLACLAASCTQARFSGATWLILHRPPSRSPLDQLPPLQVAQVVIGLGLFLLLQEVRRNLSGTGKLLGICLTGSSLYWLAAGFLDPYAGVRPVLFFFSQSLALAFLVLGLWLLLHTRSARCSD